MKNIIITGGTGGIGKKIIKTLIGKYHITIIGRDKNSFNSLDIDKKNVVYYTLDISSASKIESFFNDYSNNFSCLYALINIAGIQQPIGEFKDNDTLDWENNFRINLFGTANMIRYALPFLKNGKHNKIINFSGGGATSSRPNFSAYAISKIGIVKLTEILASELQGDFIDINAVAPGAINTGMLEEIINARTQLSEEEYNQALDRKRTGGDSPDRVIKLCQFLLSKDSNGITGKLISAIWDDYFDFSFISRLKSDKDFCTLRRIDSINFDNNL